MFSTADSHKILIFMLGIKEKTYICSENIPVCSAVRAHLLDRGALFYCKI